MTATLMLPAGAFAQDLTGYTAAETRICTIAQIQSGEGVCSQLEMPEPPQDVRVRVYRRTVATNEGLGGFNTGAGAAVVLAVVAAAALAGSSTNGTN
eukprot:CAMPEP_0201966894 /NCGR_PEP_ID=MMETSP0904-20121228/11731_1 /ASSEMBLY_ACC=CAM_ASM_000553 /TAXON_ID=420261 /ORGANISM="Thalassiosira antarctica, Strain CCMP982" /LENGTH=96 /DNA_ID=CAMNT_0048514221 /DNA_START=147 /DNA_END=437 /DNA_ORIENTATION=+